MSKLGVSSTSLNLATWQQQQENKENIYILAEAAINPFVREFALSKHQGDETALYWQPLGEAHASISPYLFKLVDWQQFENAIAFQPNWGVLIVIKPDLMILNNVQQALLFHLREWTFVESPSKEPMLLRISDFQVLKTLCAASNGAELNGIFGSVQEFAYWQQGQEEIEVLTVKESSERVPYRSPQPLSEKQHQALEAFALVKQHQEYSEHLKTHHTAVRTWSNETLANFLSSQIEKVHNYGFHNKQDTVRYLSLAVVFGNDFDQAPWAKGLLQTNKLQGDTSRMDRLYQAAFAQINE